MSAFPEATYAYIADTDAYACTYATPLTDGDTVDQRVDHYEKVPRVTEIRVAEYRLVRVSTVYIREDPAPCTT